MKCEKSKKGEKKKSIQTQPNRFKKPSEGGAYRERQNLHEASLLIILTACDILASIV